MSKMRSRFKLPAALLLALALGSYYSVFAEDSPAPVGTTPASRPAGPTLVMIIRHAEKPPEGEKNSDLSERGFERAKALAKTIPDHFPKPDFLIAAKRSKNSNRSVETITPLAEALHETIDSTVKDASFDEVAHAVLTDPKYSGKVVLIAWHHGKIPELAKALGAKNAPDTWSSSVFDRVWEIKYENGAATFTDVPENALPGDSEK